MHEGRSVRRLAASTAVLAVIVAGCTDSSGDPVRTDSPFTLTADGFGTTRVGASFESVMEALRARWGPPDQVRDMGCDSFAQSKLVNWDGVQLVFNDRGLAGYRFGPRPKDAITPAGKDVQQAATVEGLHLGDTVGTARRLYGERFVLEETSLGPEWYLDPGSDKGSPLGGFTTGLAETGTITHIKAGDICAVR
jgi:hypothetical protein